jgi:ABC-type Fe2+-enterobactin transport system substrate-binding protein
LATSLHWRRKPWLSATRLFGGDSALPLYDQLKTIAPTLVINYDDKSWQTLLTQLCAAAV